MISHARFGRLRLAQFRPDADIVELENWEFMDQIWVGEAIGFSEWLRLTKQPHLLKSLAIDFTEFPKDAAALVLRTIGLPVHAGMRLRQLRDLLGEPVETIRFVNDRETHVFNAIGTPRYTFYCTVLKKGGLNYLVVLTPLPKRGR